MVIEIHRVLLPVFIDGGQNVNGHRHALAVLAFSMNWLAMPSALLDAIALRYTQYTLDCG
jgi:hypothetical protein